MDFSKKSLSPSSRFGILNPTPSDSQRTSIAREVTQEADENGGHFHNASGLRSQNPGKESTNFKAAPTSAIRKKKILAEKNDAPFSDSFDLHYDITPQAKARVGSGHFDADPQVMPLSSKLSESGDQNAISSDCSHLAPYDPLINYTSPRPEFLRYNPNRRKEILRRIEGEMKNEEERPGADTSSSSDSKKIFTEDDSSPLQTSFQDKDVQERKEGVSDANDDETEDEEMEVRPWYSRIAWRLFLLLGVLLPSFFYICCVNYAPASSLQEYQRPEENYHLIQNGWLDQQSHDPKISPGNFLATLIGLSNECLDIRPRQLTCGTLVEDGTLSGGDLAAEEMSEEVISSAEIDQEAYIEENSKGSTDAGSEKVEILGAESAEVHNIDQLLNESSQVPEAKLLANDSSVGQDVQIDTSFELEKDCGEEAQVRGNLEVAVSASSSIQNGFKTQESEISSKSVMESKWDCISLFASKYAFQLLYSSIFFSMILGFNGLHKYFPKFHKNSTPASQSPPALKPASELALEKKNSSIMSAKEEMDDRVDDSDGYQRPLAHSNDEHKYIGVQPPTVELLVEFSVIKGTVSRTCSDQNVRRGSADSAEKSQFSQSKMSVKRSLSSSANKVYPSPSEYSLAPESISAGNSIAQKRRRKKDAGDREEVVKAVATPLRRSNRLRN